MRFKMCECNFGERTPKYISGKRNGKKMKEEEEKKIKMETSDSLLCIQAIISSVFCNQLPFSCEAEHTVSHHVQKKTKKTRTSFCYQNLKNVCWFHKKKKLLLRTENPPRSRSQVDIVLPQPTAISGSHCGSFQGPILLFLCHFDRISE